MNYNVFYNQTVVGTCSCCGGPVTVPSVWLGVVPPTPTCNRCGATKAEDYGPVVPMVPRRTWTSTGTGLLSGKWKDEYGNEWSSYDFALNGVESRAS